MVDQPAFWLLVASIFLVGGGIKGTVGIGLPTFVLAVLTQFIDPRLVIACLIGPTLISNFQQSFSAGMIKLGIRRYWRIYVPLFSGVLIGTQIAANLPVNFLRLAVGGAIVIFVASSTLFRTFELSSSIDRVFQITVGTLGGVLGGLTSLHGPPVVVYTLSQSMNPDEMIGTVGFLLMTGSLAILIGYILAGLTSPSLLLSSLLLVAPTMVGMKLGQLLRAKIPTERIKSAILIVFLLLGLKLLVDGFASVE